MSRRRKSKPYHRQRFRRKAKETEEKRTVKRILIVAECKSEVSYFSKIRESIDFSTLRVVNCSGSAPKNVILEAERICSDSFENDYEQVFCVFDRDTVLNYTESIELLNNLNKKRKFRGTEFIAIPSIPCFEYWYLLHMRFTTRSFSGYESPCDELVKELKKFSEFENYTKSTCAGFFSTLEQNQNTAISNAERSLRAAQKTGHVEYHEDPSTRVHIVVKAIFEQLDS